MFYPMEPRQNNEIIEPRINLEDVPITALSQKTRSKLSILLNPEKVLVNEDGYYRDWRGIFALSGLMQSEYALISQSDDKFSKLLNIWMRKNLETGVYLSLSQLQHCFALIDRYDIFDDTMILFAEDAIAFKRHETQPVAPQLKVELENSNILTFLDQEHFEKGLPLPVYDALVIYSEENKDIEFAAELTKRLSAKNYMLCLKDQDLLPGLPFETDALLTLLSKRCNRLIVIISKAFLQSNMQIFLTNYAQALGIEQGKRKIIPCLIEPCELPQMLRFCFRLDYFRNNKLFDFWDKLDKSLKVTSEPQKSSAELATNQPSPSQQQQDVVCKISQIPKTPEKVKKLSFSKRSPETEPKRQIMPPPPKLRQSSSMVDLETISISNGSIQNTSNVSQSSLNLNSAISFESQNVDGIKLKRKKWYSMFLPPLKEKVKAEGIENKPVKEKKEKKLKWYKRKKKEKITVQF